MGFITRSNATLLDGTNTFRFAGGNFYSAVLSDHAGTNYNSIGYMSNHQITDGLQTVKEMGGTVVRCHSAGISVGDNSIGGGPTTNLTLFPTLASLTNNTPTAATFERIDKFIYTAGQLGLRLIIPLTDDHTYYHGNLYVFLGWRGYNVSGGNPDATPFYTNSTVISDFKKYISALLTHTNQYNSIAYKDDPTILAWETGNELQTVTPPTSWTSAIATHIKTTIGAQQLILDGSGGNGTYTPSSAALALSNVDMYSDHYYPPSIGQIQSTASTVTQANKVFITGEYDWTLNYGGTSVMSLDTSTVPSGGGTQSLKMVVTPNPASQDYYDQLQQGGISLTSGDNYTLSFYAKSLSPTYTTQLPLHVVLQESSGNYTTYAEHFFSTSTSWTQYSFTFQSPVTDNATLLCFNLGNVATTTWIDLISLTDNAAPGTNLVQNGNFANATMAPWLNNNTVFDTLQNFLSAIEQTNDTTNGYIAGDLFWDIYPHDDTYGFVQDSEKYTMYYPGIDNGTAVTASDMQTRSQALRTHAYTMQGVVAPAASTDVPLVGPTFTSVVNSATYNTLQWQGVVGAASYNLERSTTGPTGTFSVVGQGLTDASPPYVDNVSVNASYRIQAFNMDGVAGPYSSVYNAYAVAPGMLVVTPSRFDNNSYSVTPTLSNTGGTAITWFFSCSLPSVTCTPSTGQLQPNASTTVNIVIPNGTMLSEDFVFMWN